MKKPIKTSQEMFSDGNALKSDDEVKKLFTGTKGGTACINPDAQEGARLYKGRVLKSMGVNGGHADFGDEIEVSKNDYRSLCYQGKIAAACTHEYIAAREAENKKELARQQKLAEHDAAEAGKRARSAHPGAAAAAAKPETAAQKKAREKKEKEAAKAAEAGG